MFKVNFPKFKNPFTEWKHIDNVGKAWFIFMALVMASLALFL